MQMHLCPERLAAPRAVPCSALAGSRDEVQRDSCHTHRAVLLLPASAWGIQSSPSLGKHLNTMLDPRAGSGISGSPWNRCRKELLLPALQEREVSMCKHRLVPHCCCSGDVQWSSSSSDTENKLQRNISGCTALPQLLTGAA